MVPPTSRPADADSPDARERLLAAGTELFAAKGFNGCGLTEILTHAGVPKGSFYHYFASKEEFGVVLIERARDEYLAELEPLVSDQTRTPRERLRALFQHTRDQCREHGPTTECLIPKLALETATLSDPVHQAVREAYARWSAVLARVITAGQAEGEIEPSHEPGRLANVLVMLWEGAAIRMQIERRPDPLDDFLAFVFDSLLPPREPRRGRKSATPRRSDV